MATLTLDSNCIDDADLVTLAKDRGVEVVSATVSERETFGTSFAAHLSKLGSIPEPGVWGESSWGKGTWGGGPDVEYTLSDGSAKKGTPFEPILEVVSNGSFPPSGKRDPLTPGQRRQLRDAMILCAHVQRARDIFVSNDFKAYIKDGRRDKLEHMFKTRIMTADEAKEYLRGLTPPS